MSCGQIALDQLGIKVDKYYASEIDKYAIQITQKNYPKTIQVGDICELDPKDFQDVDLIMGGSPCQGFSFAGKQLAFDDPRSKLFFEFVRMVEGVKPKYFLLENVRMKKEYLQVITDMLGVEPIFINSALVSAQSRQRYYWTNIPNIKEPEDRGIVLKDILENEVDDKYSAGKNLITNYRGGNQLNPNYKSQANTIHNKNDKSGTLCAGTHGYANGYVETKPKQVGIATDINGHDILKRVYSPEGKSPTLNSMGGGNREPKVAQKNLTWRKLTPLECERLQTVPDNYTDGVSNTQRYKMLGNGWTVEVIKHILGNMA